jgi:thiamine biosynthesis lipoprotein
MNGRFELVLADDWPAYRLRAAGEEALEEIPRLERRLSRFDPRSDISAANAFAAERPVQVAGETFDLLQQSVELAEATDGAFDVTIGPLVVCWRQAAAQGRPPSPEAITAARAAIGWQGLVLDAEARTVAFANPGMSLDLGGIGKGFAIAAAAEVLRELGIGTALLHAATSSVIALGAPPDQDAWRLALRHPLTDERLAVATLRDSALSVSGVHGSGFEWAGRFYGHVIDPRTGEPTLGPLLAVVRHPSPVVAEALSTALLVAGRPLFDRLAERWPEADAWVVPPADEPPWQHGDWLEPPEASAAG